MPIAITPDQLAPQARLLAAGGSVSSFFTERTGVHEAGALAVAPLAERVLGLPR